MLRTLMLWITALFVAGMHAAVSASDAGSPGIPRAECVISLDATRDGRPVSRYLTGFNLSYFNDLDTLWTDKRIFGCRRLEAFLMRLKNAV
jgi:hypothetical protein